MRNFFKPILYCIICCFSLTKSFGQNIISGKVLLNETNEAIIGANIYIPELRTGTSTDVNGFYQIKNLPKGEFTLQVSYVSLKTITKKVSVKNATKQDFEMENSATSLEEVVITGAGIKTLVKESPVPIAALSRTQWLQSTSTNLVDAIVKLPGVSQIMTGPTLSKPIIRGLGFNRVITVHDGVRQEDNQWGEEHSLHIDEFSIERYEIIRGAGSLMYGSDGLGGVISVISPTPTESEKINGSVLYNYQTNNGLHGFSANLGGNKNGFVWTSRFSHKNAGNYQNAFDGLVNGSKFQELNYSGMIGLNKKWGFSRIYFSKFGQDINIIDGLRDAEGHFTKQVLLDGQSKTLRVTEQELKNPSINPSNSQSLSNYKVSWNNFLMLGKSSLSLNLAYSQNHRREYGNVLKPFEADLYFYLQTLYYDARFNFPEKNNLEVTIGTNGMAQTMNNRGNETLYPNFNLFDNGVFVFSKKKFNQLIMSGGLRFDIRQLDIHKLYIDSEGKFQTQPSTNTSERFAGFNKTFQNATGSFGAVYKINDLLSVKTNIARGFRAPSVPEISSNGEHAGTFRYEIGNINQQSEVSLQNDFGFTFENSSLYIDVNLFSNRINHYTFSERVQNISGKDSIINDVPVFRYQQGNARLLGLEAVVTYNPASARWFSFTQSFSSVNGVNLSAKNDSAKYLPFMPPPRWLSNVKLTKNTLGNHLRNTYFSVELEHNQQQNNALLAYNTETKTPAYSLVNIGTGATITNLKKKALFSVYLNVNNLLDNTYQSHQSRLKYLDVNQTTGRQGVYNMGRNISVKVLVPIN
ncbi:TonB-dependent receptor [Arcicella rosea]|uniref:Iron complex outermembrane receptor protein n=1 Tax=Arcicella rosea TaxID=502909 RepID=A0A841EWN2_9BACT|nr:TonB-dependent receptor [Arcicella rosea]MBB6005028.1 iron complex outermembrane receptor protein [Arcicella rosea]